jgi:photosystem II stability/assembly factor-like uncharacterized protein
MSASYDDPEFNAHLLSPGGFFHIDLLYAPLFDIYFAGISERGLFVSMDRGTSWRDLTTLRGWGLGLPDGSEMRRISLATRDRFIWALVLKKPFPKDKEKAFELFQSDDGGHFWTSQPLLVADAPLPFKGALMYVAAPPNSNTLLVATEHLYRRDDFQDPTSQWAKIEHNIHGDQHVIAFAGAVSWYVGDDGGAWATTDRGDHWNSLNLDLHTLEFFSATADSADSGPYAGGMNDNGPALTGGNPAWSQLATGDGAYVLADPRESGAFFMSETNGDIFHVRLSAPRDLKHVIGLGNLNRASGFLPPFELLPTDPRLYASGGFPGFDFKASRILLAGANNPWLVAFNPDAADRNTIAVQLTCAINGIVHYIAPVPGDPMTAYLTAGSALYRLSNISFAGNATVAWIRGESEDPNNPINGDLLGHLAVSRPGILYLIKVGFVDGQKIFSSADGGNTWTNISGELPNTPLHWVTVDPIDPNFIFVSGDTGIYVAMDGGVEGEEWRRLGSGLPNVPVMQTQISRTRKLIAATYGRGVWALDISNLTGVTGDPVLIQSTWGDQGNFELLVPQGDVIRHYFRNNDERSPAWHFLREFGYPAPPIEKGLTPRAVTFMQSNYRGDGVHGNFEAIVRVSQPIASEPDSLDFWYFDSGQLRWNGSFLLC